MFFSLYCTWHHVGFPFFTILPTNPPSYLFASSSSYPRNSSLSFSHSKSHHPQLILTHPLFSSIANTTKNVHESHITIVPMLLVCSISTPIAHTLIPTILSSTTRTRSLGPLLSSHINATKVSTCCYTSRLGVFLRERDTMCLGVYIANHITHSLHN